MDPNKLGEGPIRSGSSSLQAARNSAGDTDGNSVKAAKKILNLIGAHVLATPPVKRQKCANEGNFVKLNINGYKKRFTNVGRKKNWKSSSLGRKSYRRAGRRKVKCDADKGEESDGLCDEDGLVSEMPQKLQETRGFEFHSKTQLIENAVSVIRNEASEENLVSLLKLTHGYDSFREGQLEAIKGVLAGNSTMLVLPTGAGKSLCYQLPAVILPGLTLVVCPLVALMIDQLKQLPPIVPGGLLSVVQTTEEVAETLKLIREGMIKVLFVSPERFLNEEFLSLLSSTQSISLVVVDEAHCLSEWSHNFRTSYMRLRASFLRARLNARCILAMTATATIRTLNTVMSALEIPLTNLVQRSYLRDNLQLSVSLSGNRMKDLLLLVKSSPFTEVRSIIIYTKFQFETEVISKYLCDNNIHAKCYHGGIPAKDRKRTQDLFCSNKIRVVVATVAFGMGLDKSDVGAVIHYSLPESLEQYVQEIGRAGRDGGLSYCHLLYDDNTYFKLRSFLYRDGVDECAVNKFLSQVFSNGRNFRGKICSLIKEHASRKFDMKEEVMLTFLTHLELGEAQYLRLLPDLSVTCTLNFHKSTPLLLASKDNVVAAILKKSETKQGQHVFDIPSVSNSIGITTTNLLNHLQFLKFKAEITYELKDPAICYTIIDVPGDICSLAADLTKWSTTVESCQVRKLDTMLNAVMSSVKECKKQNGCHGAQHTSCLQREILEYFNADDDNHVSSKMAQNQSSRFLRPDIKVFLQSNSQAKFTPRAVARIMHGIPSPAYPSVVWSKTHFWGRYIQMDFRVVMQAAKAELMHCAGKEAL